MIEHMIAYAASQTQHTGPTTSAYLDYCIDCDSTATTEYYDQEYYYECTDISYPETIEIQIKKTIPPRYGKAIYAPLRSEKTIYYLFNKWVVKRVKTKRLTHKLIHKKQARKLFFQN
jgi:hypothetical protein